MSVVSVWTTSKPRVEVRTIAQAISETGRRLSDIVLLPSQADLLAQPSLQRLWLTGPMGSGKTIMLQLKGRQWLMEGKRVIVINIRTVSRGRPHGHALEEGIQRGAHSHPGTGSIERYDIALDEFKFETLVTNIAAGGPKENACFVVDEVLSDMSSFPQKVIEHFPDCPVWCVAPYVTPVPSTFQQYRLGAVLRNPPSVQLMLKELDLNPRHRHVYTTRSAARGLPCDGPPIIFIEHSKHNTHVRHLDCSQCADELADIFESKLGLQLHPPATDETGHFPTKVGVAHPKSNESKKHQMTFEAAPLSFRDVLILMVFPISVYKHVADYHWEVSIAETLQYLMYMGTSRFLWGLIQRGVPIRVAFDNTLKEIAFPPEDEVIITDVMGVHSLERKVVVLLQGGPSLTQEEVAEHISRYQFVQAGCHPGQQPQHDSQTKLTSNQQPLKTPPENNTDSKQLLFVASAMHEVRDFLYPQLPTSFSPCPSEAKVIVNRLFSNMMVAATQRIVGNSEQKQGFHTQQTSSTLLPVSELRVGKVYREDLPMLPGQGGSADAAPAVQRDDEGGECVTELNSVFLVPGLKEEGDEGERESELRRIQQAMAMLSEDDLDWDFFAATRCLSQYISILP